jgi:hypothetical protein
VSNHTETCSNFTCLLPSVSLIYHTSTIVLSYSVLYVHYLDFNNVNTERLEKHSRLCQDKGSYAMYVMFITVVRACMKLESSQCQCVLMFSVVAVLLLKQSAHTLHALLLLLCTCCVRCVLQACRYVAH